MNNAQHLNVSMSRSAHLTAKGTALIVVESCIFVLLNIAAFVGNSLVCLAFYRNPSLRTVTNYFVLSLALTDLSMAVLVMPLSSISAMTNTWITKELGCKLNYLCSNVLGAISLFTTMFLAINRYIRVVRPALYANIFSKKRSVAMAVCVWIAAILSVTLVVLITGNKYQTFTIQPASCFQFLADNIQPKLYDEQFQHIFDQLDATNFNQWQNFTFRSA